LADEVLALSGPDPENGGRTTRGEIMRGPQDYGGMPAGPVDPEKHEHVPTHWEKTVDAMMMLLFDQRRRLARVDESRRMQEALGDDYHKYPYYERWLQAISWLMLEKGVYSQEELEAKKAEVRARLEAGSHGS
jgi:hypothetical protein